MGVSLLDVDRHVMVMVFIIKLKVTVFGKDLEFIVFDFEFYVMRLDASYVTYRILTCLLLLFRCLCLYQGGRTDLM